MAWRDYITVDPDICHGQACIKGTQIMISVTRQAIQASITCAAELARERIISVAL